MRRKLNLYLYPYLFEKSQFGIDWWRSHSYARRIFICICNLYLYHVFGKSHSGLNWRRSRGRANETTAVNATAIANVVDLTLVDNDRVDKKSWTMNVVDFGLVDKNLLPRCQSTLTRTQSKILLTNFT